MVTEDSIAHKNRGTLYDFQNTALFRRYVCTAHPGSLSERGKISGFSPRSGARMRRYLRSCTAEYTHLYTLTYPSGYPTDGEECKRHLKNFIARLRRYCGRDGNSTFSFFWFLEFQKRGAPHFHGFCTHPADYKMVAQWWYEVVGSDDRRHLHAGTRVERLRSGRFGTVSYATKYAAKLEQKDAPENFINVGRFWGVYGNRTCMAASILFHDTERGNELKKAFCGELALVIKAHQQKIKRMRIPGPNGGLYLGSSRAVLAVSGFMYRKMARLMGEPDVSCQYPTEQIDLEPGDDSFSAP